MNKSADQTPSLFQTQTVGLGPNPTATKPPHLSWLQQTIKMKENFITTLKIQKLSDLRNFEPDWCCFFIYLF